MRDTIQKNTKSHKFQEHEKFYSSSYSISQSYKDAMEECCAKRKYGSKSELILAALDLLFQVEDIKRTVKIHEQSRRN